MNAMIARRLILIPAAAAAMFATMDTALSGAVRQASGTAASTIDVEKLGPQVGSKVPDFRLPDQNGATRTLASILGPRGAAIVFFRSADW